MLNNLLNKRSEIAIVSFVSFSFIWFTSIFFSYSEVFFYYVSQSIQTPFFITDTNVFAACYFSSIVFFSFLFYALFFYSTLIFIVTPLCTEVIYKLVLRLFFVMRYLHIVTIFCNHFDFSDFKHSSIESRAASRIESIDFASYINQYTGSFWDFFRTIAVIYMFIFVLFEDVSVLNKFRYSFSYNKRIWNKTSSSFYQSKNEWVSFNFSWVGRFITFFCALYFFGGEGLGSDLLVIRFSLISFESLLLFQRSLYFIHSVGKLGS